MAVLMLRPPVTSADLERLAPGQADKARADAARKVCLKIVGGGMSDAERRAAAEIVRIFASDPASAVRRALATTLQSSPLLPRDIAARLARDSDEIAVPLLERSPVLTSDDLIAAVREGAPIKQCAVARRDPVTAVVVDAIVNHGCEPAVALLARNDKADFHPAKMMVALVRFGDRPVVTDALIGRAFLPASIAERLVPLVSDAALQRLARRHPLPPQVAVELASRGAGTIDLLDQAGCAKDMRRFVQQVQAAGKLDASLMVRGLCLGLMGFFEHAMSELAGVPHRKTWALIHESGPLGLRAIFERSGAPARLFAPMCAAIEIYEQIEMQGLPEDRDQLARMMIERILARPVRFSKAETDYLLGKLDAIAKAGVPAGAAAGGRASRSLLSA